VAFHSNINEAYSTPRKESFLFPSKKATPSNKATSTTEIKNSTSSTNKRTNPTPEIKNIPTPTKHRKFLSFDTFINIVSETTLPNTMEMALRAITIVTDNKENCTIDTNIEDVNVNSIAETNIVDNIIVDNNIVDNNIVDNNIVDEISV
jgi:hypothetical protein